MRAEKEVAILGMGWGAVRAPLHIERWGLNNSYLYGRIDKLFLMHKPNTIINTMKLPGRGKIDIVKAFEKYPDMGAYSLEAFNIEKIVKPEFIYGSDQYETKFNFDHENPKGEVARHVEKYPLGMACQLSGGMDFSCSAAYAIAMAILQGFTRIRLYGFEIWTNKSEYAYERPCVERWIHRAEGRNIFVEVPFSLVPPMLDRNSSYGYTV